METCMESCRTYLLTYSKADLTRVPDAAAFANLMMKGFDLGFSKVFVEYWAACMEAHADGETHH